MNIIAFVLKCIFSPSKTKTLEHTLDIDAKLFNKRNDIVVVASSSVPHRDVARVIGSVTGVSTTQPCSKEQFELAEKEAKLELIEKAQSLGANAVVDLKMTSGAYDPNASIWHHSPVACSGTAVVVS